MPTWVTWVWQFMHITHEWGIEGFICFCIIMILEKVVGQLPCLPYCVCRPWFCPCCTLQVNKNWCWEQCWAGVHSHGGYVFQFWLAIPLVNLKNEEGILLVGTLTFWLTLSRCCSCWMSLAPWLPPCRRWWRHWHSYCCSGAPAQCTEWRGRQALL